MACATSRCCSPSWNRQATALPGCQANKPKTTFLVQASTYCELLTPLLGHRPDQFWAWYQRLRPRYRQFREGFDPAVIPEDAPEEAERQAASLLEGW